MANNNIVTRGHGIYFCVLYVQAYSNISLRLYSPWQMVLDLGGVFVLSGRGRPVCILASLKDRIQSPCSM